MCVVVCFICYLPPLHPTADSLHAPVFAFLDQTRYMQRRRTSKDLLAAQHGRPERENVTIGISVTDLTHTWPSITSPLRNTNLLHNALQWLVHNNKW